MRVLLVEDSPEVQNLLTDLLKHKCCQFDTAWSLHEGLRSIGKEHYDLIILDYRLPDGTGLELARIIRGGSPHVILFTSEPISLSFREETESLGISRVFRKPDETFSMVGYVNSYGEALDKGNYD